MFRYAVVGSGSQANAYIFESQGASVLVDNGFSCRELLARLDRLGFDPGRIRSLLLTHLHSDHFRGVLPLARRLGIPVVCHSGIARRLAQEAPAARLIPVSPGAWQSGEGFEFYPFLTSHDSPHSMGYALRFSRRTFSLITDTGRLNPEMRALARQSEVIFLEANYDPELLEGGDYPRALKRRIASETGHLSNGEAVDFLNSLGDCPLRRVYFCHLSENNNDPQRLEGVINERLTLSPAVYICCRGGMIAGEDFLEGDKNEQPHGDFSAGF
ncbi:MAG: MBL fold metallo-hydrolase [Spirochaetales bacterium]|jgi:phosphoribosyl 1,2-cyclic phosphodiesterase|nr:MBL fold metallo-hydrolase [Spirochaetales bacterium]